MHATSTASVDGQMFGIASITPTGSSQARFVRAAKTMMTDAITTRAASGTGMTCTPDEAPAFEIKQLDPVAP